MALKPPYRTKERRGAPDSGEVGDAEWEDDLCQHTSLGFKPQPGVLWCPDSPFVAQCPPQSLFAVIYPSTSQPGTALIVRGGTQVLQQSILQASQ